MSGLLALLDDVAAIAKVAAASIDDIATSAAKTGTKVAGSVIDDAIKAGTKAAGAVIDDAAVTPKYTMGFSADRELPIVWRIARGSLFNKLAILLPAGLLLNTFLPQAIPPLLILGGAYLCFEGAEKVLHWWHPHAHGADAGSVDVASGGAHLEETKVRGAVKTDFILSAEIMTIALSEIPESTFWLEALTLAVVAVGITVLVYGAVALIVKADDLGVRMATFGRLAPTRWLGRKIVKGMPSFMTGLTLVGTLAMLWVGGSIVIHSLEQLGIGGPAHAIHDLAAFFGHMVELGAGAVEWGVTALVDGVLGLALGLALVPLAERVIQPTYASFTGQNSDP